jgi:hypothetical protein
MLYHTKFQQKNYAQCGAFLKHFFCQNKKEFFDVYFPHISLYIYESVGVVVVEVMNSKICDRKRFK